ncbi:YihY/virulence factor BrkB family protein [Streptococcus sp. DD12]|uniref:YihY/virulence factor BrkB family protein n=1 Tax=Streptococcus sp. DD12 TaxID=1777880 RepID=UPI00079C0025|nr:YihY/virulence factor BrkB family protein [Streptococcus sp. DD12]KXT76617.1 Inner membrane protein YihY, formerly thought to be RNase BN [Streptococcus sp. DD12]
MAAKKLSHRLLERLSWAPLQVWLKHYASAEVDLSSVAVAYYLLLTVFPLMVLAANIFPYLGIKVSTLLGLMKEGLPPAFYAPAEAITRNIFARPSTGILSVAVLAAFWTLSKSLGSLQKAINKAYGASQHRDFIVSSLVGAFIGILILFLLGFTMFLPTAIKLAVRLLRTRGLAPYLLEFLGDITYPITLGLLFLGLSVLYLVLPNVKITKLRFVLPGTALTSAFLVLFSSLVSTYIIHMTSRYIDIKVFGSVMIFIVMIWFIFLGRVLILGAVLNATVQELVQGELKGRRGDVATILQDRKEKRED